MPRPKPLSAQMRSLVKASGRPQRQIADATGIDPASLSRFVRGKRSLSQSAWDALGRFFSLELTESHWSQTAEEKLQETVERSDKRIAGRKRKAKR